MNPAIGSPRSTRAPRGADAVAACHRISALDSRAADLQRQALATDDETERAELLGDALAVRERQLELVREAA